MKLEYLQKRVKELNEQNDNLEEIIEYIIAPKYPARLRDYRIKYNELKDRCEPYQPLPMEELLIYAVKPAIPYIGNPEFLFFEIGSLGMSYHSEQQQ